MNRRQFLYAGTGLATFSTARSFAAIAGANDRVSLGIIGLGRRGLIVGNAFAQNAKVQIVALCDIYDKQTDHFESALSSHLAHPARSVNHHELLARKEVDAVLISTPDHLHVQIATDSLAANKNIYLEKPTLHRWHERTALLKAAGDTNKLLQCGMQQRSGAHYLRAKQEIFDTGKLGKVVFVRCVWSNFPWQRRNIPSEPKPAGLDWDLFLGPAPRVPYLTARYSSWRSYRDYGNGVLADILTHWVDVAQWMLNDSHPVTASALGGIYQLHDGRDNPDTVSSILQYKSWNLNFESSVLSVRDEHPSVFFEGTEGTLNLTREGYTFTPNKGEPIVVTSTQDLEQAHTANFVDAIVSGSRLNAPISAGMDATLPVQMALHSYWQHKLTTPSDLM